MSPETLRATAAGILERSTRAQGIAGHSENENALSMIDSMVEATLGRSGAEHKSSRSVAASPVVDRPHRGPAEQEVGTAPDLGGQLAKPGLGARHAPVPPTVAPGNVSGPPGGGGHAPASG